MIISRYAIGISLRQARHLAQVYGMHADAGRIASLLESTIFTHVLDQYHAMITGPCAALSLISVGRAGMRTFRAE